MDEAMTTTASVAVRGDDSSRIFNSLHILHRRDGGAATLGLGWLIAIVLCGGVSLFIGVGFALAWRAQKRRTPLTITRTTASLPYEASGFASLLQRPSTTRLTKRRMTVVREHSDLSCSSDEEEEGGIGRRRLSRFSLIRLPSLPVLPMLPSYSTFRMASTRRTGSYRKEKGWLGEDEEADVGGARRPGSGSGWAGGWSQQGSSNPQTVGHKAMMQGVAVTVTPAAQEPQQQYQQHQQQWPPQQQQQQRPISTDYDHLYEYRLQAHDAPPSMPAKPSAVYTGDSAGSMPPPAPAPPPPQPQPNYSRPPPAAAKLARQPSRTDSDLRDILRSTEQRLRAGDRSRSRSPEKMMMLATPQGSPTRTATTRGGGGGGRPQNYSGSPARSIPRSTSGGGGMGTREGSAASIGSAANSLILHATEELQLPGGMGSPSRLRGHEWLAGDDAILQLTTPQQRYEEEQQQQEEYAESARREYQQRLREYQLQQQKKQQQYLLQQQQKQQQQYQLQQVQQQRSPQRSPQRNVQRERSQRRRSVDSDASSSLSTLYSVGDDDDAVDGASIQAVVEGPDDPFAIGRNGVPVLAPPLQTAASAVHYNPRPRDQSRQPQGAGGYHRTHKSLDVQRFAGALPPPGGGDDDDEPGAAAAAAARRAQSAVLASPQVSESSYYTDMSVDTTTLSFSSEDTITAEDEEVEGVQEEEEQEEEEEQTTPVKQSTRRQDSDASSSPFSEHDIANMIIASQSPTRRALPAPPVLLLPDGSVAPTGLSPPPKSVARNNNTAFMRAPATDLTRQASVASSNYSNADATSTYYAPPVPPKPAAGAAAPAAVGLSVCHSVAELRRMNSVISVASNTSLTSSVADPGATLRPTVSDASRLRAGPPRMGNRQYLNVGGGQRTTIVSGGGLLRPGGPRPKRNSGHMRSHTTVTSAAVSAATTTAAAAPERPPKNPRRSLVNARAPASQQREKERDNGKENAGLGIVGGAQPQPPVVKSIRVAELVAAERRRSSRERKRGSVDSLGLYDKDGFLLPSPERELHKKLLRM